MIAVRSYRSIKSYPCVSVSCCVYKKEKKATARIAMSHERCLYEGSCKNPVIYKLRESQQRRQCSQVVTARHSNDSYAFLSEGAGSNPVTVAFCEFFSCFAVATSSTSSFPYVTTLSILPKISCIFGPSVSASADYLVINLLRRSLSCGTPAGFVCCLSPKQLLTRDNPTPALSLGISYSQFMDGSYSVLANFIYCTVSHPVSAPGTSLAALG